MLDQTDGSAGWIVTLGHSQGSWIACNMNNFAVRKPLNKLGDMFDIHRELHAGTLTTGKARDLVNDNPYDRADASARPHDPARNFFPQRGIVHDRNAFKAPKRAFQTGDVLSREA